MAPQIRDQLPRPAQRLDLVDHRHVVLRLSLPNRVSLTALHLLAGDGGHKLIATHADMAMNSPDRQNHASRPEGPIPGDRMVVVAVHQGAVHVENRGARHLCLLPACPRSSTRSSTATGSGVPA